MLKLKYEPHIKLVNDFPISGVLFRDVTPLLLNSEMLNEIAQDFSKMINLNEVDAFAGIESRGFIFATLMAAKFNKGFLPIRKAGKLPPPVVQESYSLEYGHATLEMAPTQKKLKVILCDDVLATGGTLKAAHTLCEKAGYQVTDMMVLINLQFLNQLKFNDQNIKALLNYN